jgi:hypothetical protein
MYFWSNFLRVQVSVLYKAMLHITSLILQIFWWIRSYFWYSDKSDEGWWKIYFCPVFML